MTKAEAIKELQDSHDMMRNYDIDSSESRLMIALEMAIKALEQEPCDVFDEYGNYKYPSDVELTEPNTATSMPCDDAISRQYLLDNCVVDKVTMPYVPVNKIKEAPSVNLQEPKTIQEKGE